MGLGGGVDADDAVGIDFADVEGAVGADGDAEGIGGSQQNFKQQRGEHSGASVADGLTGLKSGLEEAEQFGLEGHPEAGDLFAIFVDGVDGFGGDVHVRLGVDAAGNGQPNEFEFGWRSRPVSVSRPAETMPRSMARTPESR